MDGILFHVRRWFVSSISSNEHWSIPKTFNLNLMGLITLIQTSMRFPDCPRLRIHNVTPIWLSEIVYCKFTNCWIMRSSSSLQSRGGPRTWQLIFHHLHNLHFFNQSGHFHPDIFMFPLPLWSRFIHVPSHWTKQSLIRTSELSNLGCLVKQNTSKTSSKASKFFVLPHIWSQCINPLKIILKIPKIIDPMQTKNHHSYNLYNFYTPTH